MGQSYDSQREAPLPFGKKRINLYNVSVLMTKDWKSCLKTLTHYNSIILQPTTKLLHIILDYIPPDAAKG